MFGSLGEYTKPDKRRMFGACVCLITSVLASIAPFVLAYLIIVPLVEGVPLETSQILLSAIGVLAALIIQTVLHAKGLGLSHKAAYGTLMRIRISLQRQFERMSLGDTQQRGTGAVKKLFVDDVDSLEPLLAHSLPEGVANLMAPVVVYITMFFFDWKLALMSLVTLPLSLVAMNIMYSVGSKKMGPYYMAGQTMNNTIIEYINGMEVIKIFNKDTESYERYGKDIASYRNYTIAWYKACWPWMAAYTSLLPCTILLTLPLGSWFVLTGLSTLPNLILVICLSLSIGIPLLKTLSFLPTIPQIGYKISALEQAFSAEPLKLGTKEFEGVDQSIFFDDISFSYGENVAIDKVSITAKAGQKTALVGESGSGKSTLAKLLVHYYDVSSGTISIGGQSLCGMSLEALNSQVSFVAQEQFLFNASIKENIRLGKLDASDEEVLKAAEKAQCLEFLERLPEGMETSAGKAGAKLSGGQRQRIALARAILKNAPIIVLDEATAFIDPENEEKIEAAIRELVKGKTLLVIAHKLPTVADADQIYVLDKGKLVSSGTHSELLETCDLYCKLYSASESSATWTLSTREGGLQ